MSKKYTELLIESTPIIHPPFASSNQESKHYEKTKDTEIDQHDSSTHNYMPFYHRSTTSNINSNDIIINNNKTSNNNSNDESKSPKQNSFINFPRQTKIIVFFCISGNFFASSSFAVISPFFPQEAAKKGISQTLTGMIFGVFPLGVFFASPVFGTYLTKIGAKFIFTCGISVAGLSSILFGVLGRGPNGWIFAIMCLLVRIFIALGCSAFQTASYAIVSYQCKDAVSTAVAIIQTFTSLGYMIGPIIGGALFTVGGYGFPFYILGSAVLLNGIAIYKFLPAIEVAERKQTDSVLVLLRSPMIVICIGNLVVGTIGLLAYESTFAAHLKEFNVEVLLISLIFAIVPGTFASFSPLWGYLTDTRLIHKPLMVAALTVTSVAWLFTGPSVLLPFLPQELSIVIGGVVFIGISYSAIIIPGMKCCIEGAVQMGFEPNLDTYALVSGLFNSSMNLGGFLGPTMVSAMVQHWGYPIGYTVVAGMSAAMALITAVFFACQRFKVNSHGKYQDLS